MEPMDLMDIDVENVEKTRGRRPAGAAPPIPDDPNASVDHIPLQDGVGGQRERNT